jgi:glycosyltransferase involved in cell wall biosynthesis
LSRRILQLVASLGGGGAETQLGYLCGGLVQRGWQVDVGVLTGGPNLALFEASGAALHWISHSGNYDPSIAWKLFGLARRQQPTIVQTWIPMMDIFGGIAARLAGLPWVMSERSSPTMIPSSPKFRVRARLARGAAAVVSNSGGGDAYWAARLPVRVPRRIIANALPLEAIDAAEPAPQTGFGLEEQRPLVLYVGRVVELKNIMGLVDALARVTREGDAVAALCGTGELLEPARRRVAELGLEGRIALPGFVSEITRSLKRAALFVSLSRYEGMPNSVMEAMAAGCPIVASDIPAHREILDDSMALFVPLDSVDAAADAMLQVLRDPGAAQRRAALARERAARWSIEGVCDAYEQLYAELGARPGAP